MMTIRGEQLANGRRYIKFAWNDAQYVPPIGQTDFIPKTGAMRIWDSGRFTSERRFEFPLGKIRSKLQALGKCSYCGELSSEHGGKSTLTSEHIIPEFLGAGLELPDASCNSCQKVTTKFEDTVADDILGAVRKHLGLRGKNGIIRKGQYNVDIGREITDNRRLPISDHPTILSLPSLFPASTYSNRPSGLHGVFNLALRNLNVDRDILLRHGIVSFSTSHIDLVRFCQMIAKIGHVAVLAHRSAFDFTPLVAKFIRTEFSKGTETVDHFDNVGSIWVSEPKSSLLHEIDVGTIEWKGRNIISARVRLFSCFDMPTYYVSVGYQE